MIYEESKSKFNDLLFIIKCEWFIFTKLCKINKRKCLN